jgi:hypothetical protein
VTNNLLVVCDYRSESMSKKNYQTRSFKMGPTANTDGLIKCLPPAQDKFVTIPNIYARKLCNFYTVQWQPDSLIYRDSIVGLVGRRSGALFFARHRDYFIVTQNFTAVYLDLLLFRSFTVTLGFATVYQDWQKTSHRDTDGT